jgi:hypothetical protein
MIARLAVVLGWVWTGWGASMNATRDLNPQVGESRRQMLLQKIPFEMLIPSKKGIEGFILEPNY